MGKGSAAANQRAVPDDRCTSVHPAEAAVSAPGASPRLPAEPAAKRNTLFSHTRVSPRLAPQHDSLTTADPSGPVVTPVAAPAPAAPPPLDPLCSSAPLLPTASASHAAQRQGDIDRRAPFTGTPGPIAVVRSRCLRRYHSTASRLPQHGICRRSPTHSK